MGWIWEHCIPAAGLRPLALPQWQFILHPVQKEIRQDRWSPNHVWTFQRPGQLLKYMTLGLLKTIKFRLSGYQGGKIIYSRCFSDNMECQNIWDHQIIRLMKFLYPSLLFYIYQNKYQSSLWPQMDKNGYSADRVGSKREHSPKWKEYDEKAIKSLSAHDALEWTSLYINKSTSIIVLVY